MKDDNKDQYRINGQIRAKEVRLVGDNIESKVYPIAQALRIAEEHEADLVEITCVPCDRVFEIPLSIEETSERDESKAGKD